MIEEETVTRGVSKVRFNSIKKLGKRREHVLCTGSSGERFLDRLFHCTQQMQFSNCHLDDKFKLEADWKSIVREVLDTKLRRQQGAVWKFIASERAYVSRLNIIINLFLALFKGMNDEGDLLDIEECHIFGNIAEILRVNEQFWMDFIFPSLERTRRKGTPITPRCLFTSATRSVNFKDIFKCYEKFCLHEEIYVLFAQRLTEPECINDSTLIQNLKKWLKWCEGLPECNKMKLIHLLKEPRVRLHEYTLLFSEILKETCDGREIEFLKCILAECNDMVHNINESMHERIEQLKLVSCLEQLDELTFMESEDETVTENCFLVINFLRLPIKTLNTPVPRCILNETFMKLVRRTKKKKVKVLIFSDVLVMTKVNNMTKKFKIVNRIYFLDKLQLSKTQQFENLIVVKYYGEFGLLAETFSFEMQPGEIDTWISIVERAKLCYENCIAEKGRLMDFFKDGNTVQPLIAATLWDNV